jgi:hypothetical protein
VVLFWFGSDAGCASGDLCRIFWLTARGLVNAVGVKRWRLVEVGHLLAWRKIAGPDARCMN